MDELPAAPLGVLRSRTSEKWREHPEDVIPMFVAEADFPLAEPIAAALHAAIERGDTGYVASRTELPRAFSGFAERRWGWRLDTAHVQTTADVSMGIVEILRRIDVGTGLVITPPVYPPFYMLAAEAGVPIVDVPLAAGGSLDLAGIQAAIDGGARAVLLCNPHNPLGHPHDAASLTALARIVDEAGGIVISDEIHAPLTHSDGRFTPWLAVSDAARRVGFALHSASKAWNIAGLKCAMMIADDPGRSAFLRSLPDEVGWRTGQFGVIGSIAAYDDGDEWLDRAILTIERNRRTLVARVREELPMAEIHEPRAGYLAWVDLGALGWDRDPAEVILERARVALRAGSDFGPGGAGRVRVNLACDPALLDEAVDRIVSVARADLPGSTS